MIQKLKIYKTASYSNLVEIEPTEINYLFGSNGTGKTALGNVIADSSLHAECSLDWKTTAIKTEVYNKNFVKASFSQSEGIQGIFTLGKDATDTQSFITTTKEQIELLKKSIEGLDNTTTTKSDELSKKKTETIGKAWNVKLKYESYFRPAYSGFMGSGGAFFNKCMHEINNISSILSEGEIKNKCEKVFSADLKAYDAIKPFVYSELSSKEQSDILSTKIIGKEDVEIGKLIKQLDNSDWVKDGVDYLQQTESQCPFCQQDISFDLRNDIESFFDETYNEKKELLNDFIQEYLTYFEGLIVNVKAVSEHDIPIIDFTELKSKIELFEEQINNNVVTLKSKQKTPSLPIELKSLEPILVDISGIIDTYISTVESNNKTVKNITSEKSSLKSEIWRFVVNELDIDIKSFSESKTNVEKAIQAINITKKEKSDKKLELEKQVREKEAEVTSVLPTVTEINKILNLFGFTNFKLDEAEKKGFYKIIREDGTEVKETLSEGEYTFVTFLYFYHLLRGSTNETGIASDKVVVIDDPISSLDSNILFVVSNLIKTIIHDARKARNGIKQVFILTHNVYFYKEVTFRGNGNNKWSEESFWIIRKLNNQTKIIKHSDNPIQTTYELLWRELDDLENINTATIFNTLRRILEYYFNILGGLDYEKAISEFEGEEQIICKSLVSWINDGSHFINDDLVVYVEPESIEKYLKVFQDIFEKMGHESHYNMMSKINIETE